MYQSRREVPVRGRLLPAWRPRASRASDRGPRLDHPGPGSPDSADTATGALLTPAEARGHLDTLKTVLDKGRAGRQVPQRSGGREAGKPEDALRRPEGAILATEDQEVPADRVKFVQALHDQGYGVEDILKKGVYMNLTRSEVVRYMSGRRPRSARG